MIKEPSSLSRQDVEDILRRAQLAILNPTVPVETFRTSEVGVYDHTVERRFSKDMAVLEIVGAPVDISYHVY